MWQNAWSLLQCNVGLRRTGLRPLEPHANLVSSGVSLAQVLEQLRAKPPAGLHQLLFRKLRSEASVAFAACSLLLACSLARLVHLLTPPTPKRALILEAGGRFWHLTESDRPFKPRPAPRRAATSTVFWLLAVGATQRERQKWQQRQTCS